MKAISSNFVSFITALAICCLCAVSPAWVNAQEVQAELQPQTFSIDEAATLRITVQDTQSADIVLPEIDGLIFHHRGQSSQIQIINGAMASSVVYSYLVEPVKAGAYEIPPIRIDMDNKTLHTEPLSCTVTGSSGSKQRPSTESGKSSVSSDLAFISFIPQKEKIYRGEVIPARIKVYFKRGTRVNQLSLPRLQGEGLLIDELSNNPPQTEEVVNNVAYSVLTWDTFVTGVKEGIHESSFELDATLLVPSRNRSKPPGFGSGFFNDDFFGDMFSNYSSRPIQVISEKTVVEVRALPAASKPEDFSGAIGQFTLKLDAQPTTINPGEPITLTMSVTGTGNFTGVEAPAVSDASGVKVYTPTAVFTPGQSPYSGTKQFQQALILTDPASREIPPVAFSYFDPDTEQYQTLFSDPLTISVNTLTGESTANQPPLPAQSVGSPDSTRQTVSSSLSLVPVKLEPGKLVEGIRPPFLANWFVAAVSLCVILIGGFCGYQIYGKVQAGNSDTAYKKTLLAKQKETLGLLQKLNPDTPDYPAQARKLVGDLLSVEQQSISVSLTTTDVISIYGRDSVVAELFELGDGALYGKQETASDTRRDLHKKVITFVTKIS